MDGWMDGLSWSPQQTVTFLSLARVASYSSSTFKVVWKGDYLASSASTLEAGNAMAFENECWLDQLIVLARLAKAKEGHRWNGYTGNVQGKVFKLGFQVWMLIVIIWISSTEILI